ncbi:MAG: hypothetical protein Q4G60_01790 [bacterium]|nr:hypothetical protein [bacterium]
MKKSRRGLAEVFIAAAMIGIMMTQEVKAAGNVSISASAETVEVGGEVSVTIKAENPAGSAEKPEISVEYDAAVLTYDSCDKETGGGGGGLLTLTDTEATIKFKGAASGTTEVKVSAILDGDGADVPTDSVTIAVGDGVGAAGADGGADGATNSNIAEGLIAINGTEKMLSTTFPNEIIPVGFHKADFTYQEQLLESAQFDMGDLTLLYVTDAGGANGEFCMYDQATDTFTDFVSINGIENKYIIIMIPDESVITPDGFTKATLQWNGKTLQAYAITASATVAGASSGEDAAAGEDTAAEGTDEVTANGVSTSDFFLLYALSSEGNKGWYLYDMKEGTYQRYLELDAAGAEEPSVLDVFDSDTDSYKSQSHTRFIVICVMAVVMLVMIILLLNLFLKLREYQSYEYIDEDEEDDEEEDDHPIRNRGNSRNLREPEHLSRDEIRARRYEAGEDLEETGEINLEPVRNPAAAPYMQAAPASPVGYETQDMTFEDVSLPQPVPEEDDEEDEEDLRGRKKKNKKEKKKSRFAKWYEDDDFGDDDDEEDEEDDDDDEDDEEDYQERRSIFGRKKKKMPEPVEATQMDWSEIQNTMQGADEDERRPMTGTRRPVSTPRMTVTEPPVQSRPVRPQVSLQTPVEPEAPIQKPYEPPVQPAARQQMYETPVQPEKQVQKPYETPIQPTARQQAQQMYEAPAQPAARQQAQQMYEAPAQPTARQQAQQMYEPPVQQSPRQPAPKAYEAQIQQQTRQPAPKAYEAPVQQPQMYEQPMQQYYGQGMQEPMQQYYGQEMQQPVQQPARQPGKPRFDLDDDFEFEFINVDK